MKLLKDCVVYTTRCTNPFRNLAFEQWMFEKVDYTSNNCLFVWQNSPTVVIGRHQNPWRECNIKRMSRANVNLCRRHSGGGTVYHDLGNLNFTFFTERCDYDRKHNLNVIIDGLKSKFADLNIAFNTRDDILLNDKYKISGSSAKLSRTKAYHHCTLLIGSDLNSVTSLLSPEPENINCRATASLRSSVANLQDAVPELTVDLAKKLVIEQYAAHHRTIRSYDIDTSDESLTPGVQECASQLMDWDWVYGRTPAFEVSLSHPMIDSDNNFGMKLSVLKGVIQQVEFSAPYTDHDFEHVIALTKELLTGCKLKNTDIKRNFDQNMHECENSIQSHYYWTIENLMHSLLN